MISIIICSRAKEISASLANNIQNTIGCEYELILVDNSENRHSIFSAYNIGVERSKFPYFCFVHDDVEFVTKDWGNKIINHLNKPNTGFIGIAGGQAALRVPLGWTSFNPFYNVIHTYLNKDNKTQEQKESFPLNHQQSTSVVLLDGVFLCSKKELFTQIQFDENFEGFHGYDLDISIQSINAGYKNFVVYDVDIKHFSKGNFDTKYIYGLLKIHEKWAEQLPIFESSFSESQIEKILYKAERSTLLRLRKRMVRAGIKLNEINPIIDKYLRQTGNKIDKSMLIFSPFQLVIIKQISILRNLMLNQERH
jgi:hypothetical protein